jgi:GNAT superfamily N-acetyltransferase
MIRIFSGAEFETHIPRFAEILIDAVASGAGVSFLAPLSQVDAEHFWRGKLASIENGEIYPLVAEVDGVIAGVVLLVRAWAPNQLHHSDISKLLVHHQFRRRGIATELMKALETKAKSLNQTLLTFDASAHGPVEAFYKSLGYTCVGHFPGYAYSGTGELEDTALFYKKL